MAADGVARFDHHTALLWCRVMTVGGIGDGGLEMSGVAELQPVVGGEGVGHTFKR